MLACRKYQKHPFAFNFRNSQQNETLPSNETSDAYKATHRLMLFSLWGIRNSSRFKIQLFSNVLLESWYAKARRRETHCTNLFRTKVTKSYLNVTHICLNMPTFAEGYCVSQTNTPFCLSYNITKQTLIIRISNTAFEYFLVFYGNIQSRNGSDFS